MNRPSDDRGSWESLRRQIIGLGEESHRKNYYPALRHSRTELVRFRAVLEEIPDMILIVSGEDDILDLNTTAARILKKERESLIGQPALTVLGPEYAALRDAPSERMLLKTSLKGSEEILRELEVRRVQQGDEKLYVVIGRDVTHLINAERKLIALNENLERTVKERTSTIRESLEELKSTQEQLILSEKMAALGGLVAGVAHEINTPLGVGITAASALSSRVEDIRGAQERGELTENRFHDFMDFLLQSSGLLVTNLMRAGDLVHSFKQVAVDQSTEAEREIRIGEYLREVVRSLYPQWKRHDLRVNGGLSVIMRTVPGVWSQVVSNLVVNSVRHGFRDRTEGGEIRLHCRKDRDFLVLDYRDNGRGIEEGLSKRIFEPFFTTARHEGGTGLGLHIVYNLVTLKLKGRIRFYKPEGGGTGFRIRVPLDASVPPAGQIGVTGASP